MTMIFFLAYQDLYPDHWIDGSKELTYNDFICDGKNQEEAYAFLKDKEQNSNQIYNITSHVVEETSFITTSTAGVKYALYNVTRDTRNTTRYYILVDPWLIDKGITGWNHNSRYTQRFFYH